MASSTLTIDPQHTALLVMDYQNSIVQRVPEGCRGPLTQRVAQAIATTRNAGATIGYVRVGLTPEEAKAVPSTNSLFAAMASSPAVAADSAATAIIDELAPQDGDITVRKTRVGSFSTTNLGVELARRSITTLVLAGISTSGVVLSTVRDGADRDYKIVVLGDGCADNDQPTHELLINSVFPQQADVINVAELPDIFATPHA